MAISFIGKASALVTGLNTATVDVPIGTAEHDLLIWVNARSTNSTSTLPIATPPSDWLWLCDGPLEQQSDVPNINVDVFYRFAPSSIPADYTIDYGLVGTQVFASVILAYRDCDLTNPIYSQQGLFPTSFSPAVTNYFYDHVGFDTELGVENTYQIVIIATPTTSSYSAPGGYTTEYNNSGTNAGTSASLGIFDGVGYGSGLGDPVTLTGTVSTNAYCGFRLFLRPSGTTSPLTLDWTVFPEFLVPILSNVPYMIRDSNNLFLYSVRTTDPVAGTIIEKFDLVNRTLLLTVTIDPAIGPGNDVIMTQDATHLYIALADQKIYKLLKTDLSTALVSTAALDCGALMGLSYNGPILWAMEDCGEFFYQINPTDLTWGSFDSFGSGLTFYGMTSDSDGNGWAIGGGSGVGFSQDAHLYKLDASFTPTDYDISADLILEGNSQNQNSISIGFDPVTKYLWIVVFKPESIIYCDTSKVLVWDTVTHSTINTFTYGKNLSIANDTVTNLPQLWNGTESSLWFPYSFTNDGSNNAFGLPGFGDFVRLSSTGTFLEKLAAENLPVPSLELIWEIQHAVISVQTLTQDIWTVFHTNLADGSQCIKMIAVASFASAFVPPPVPTTTCFDLAVVGDHLQGVIHGTNLTDTYQVTISPTNDPDNPDAYNATILSTSATAVTVGIPDGKTGIGYWFVFTNTDDIIQVTAGNNQLCPRETESIRFCAPRVIDLRTFHYGELFLFGGGVTPMPILNSTIDDFVIGSNDELIRLVQAIPDGVTLEKVWFTVKENLTQEDSEALIQKVITAVLGADGQITDIGTSGTGSISFLFVPADTNGGKFSSRKVYWYDLTFKLSNGKIYTGREIGLLRFVAAVTETAV